ncbi:MAG: radical SAM protein, partial [Candidatus Paceibacterota bacterium]
MTKIKEIRASSIITKSNLPDADYVINPYVGCTHSCLYCYARFMKRFTGHAEPWGEFVDVKINAPDLIPTKATKYQGKSIFIASVTDAYLPFERKYQLTRKILERLIPLNPNLGVQTKSDLVLRDIDLLKQFRYCEVGLTITTLDDSLRREIEPFTSSVPNRIKALERLKEAGLRTYVFVGPIMPGLTDWKKIILETKGYSDLYMFENLNVTGNIWDSIKKWLQE